MKYLKGLSSIRKKFMFLFMGELLILTILLMGGLFRQLDTYHFGQNDLISEDGNITNEGIYVQAATPDKESYIFTPFIDLAAGSYTISIVYETSSNDISIEIYDRAYLDERIEYRGKTQLKSSDEVINIPIRVRSKANDVVLKTTLYGNSSINIESIDISENNAYWGEVLVYVVLLFLLIDFIAFSHTKKNFWTKGKLLVLISVLVACIPLLLDFMVKGHDMEFHYLRIEGIYEALKYGQFPVRINPTFLEGFGYPNPIYYPELFLYIPALLRLLGLPIMRAYKVFLVLINISTAVVAFQCGKKFFKNETVAGFFSLVYTLSIYRLVNLYYRAALGELLAQIFIPLVFWGLFLIIKNQTSKNELREGTICLTIGLTGIIQSHILSCALVGIFSIIILAISIKKLINLKVIWNLIQTAFWVCVLNVWFLVPFLQGMREKVRVNTLDGTDKVGRHALQPYQLFAVNQRALGISNTILDNITDEMPLSLGLSVIILGGVTMYYIHNYIRKKQYNKLGAILITFSLGMLSAWMTTSLFPWDMVVEIPKIGKVLAAVQFPWRYLGIASFFIIVSGILASGMIKNEIYRKTLYLGLLVVSVLSAMFFYQSMIENVAPTRVYEADSLDTRNVGSGEYLYSYVNPENMDLSYSDECLVSKQGTTLKYKVIDKSDSKQYIKLPLLYSPFYCAKAEGVQEDFELIYNDDNFMCVIVPEEYCGEIDVYIGESTLWLIADMVSVIALAGFAIYYILSSKHVSVLTQTVKEGQINEK